jgi:hypothetical protein
MIDVLYKIKIIIHKINLSSISSHKISTIHQKYLVLIYKIHLKVNNL